MWQISEKFNKNVTNFKNFDKFPGNSHETKLKRNETKTKLKRNETKGNENEMKRN